MKREALLLSRVLILNASVSSLVPEDRVKKLKLKDSFAAASAIMEGILESIVDKIEERDRSCVEVSFVKLLRKVKRGPKRLLVGYFRDVLSLVPSIARKTVFCSGYGTIGMCETKRE